MNRIRRCAIVILWALPAIVSPASNLADASAPQPPTPSVFLTAHDWYHSFQDRSGHAFAQLFAPDGKLIDKTDGITIQGRAQIADYIVQNYALLPDWQLQQLYWIPGDSFIATGWISRGHYLGSNKRIKAKGHGQYSCYYGTDYLILNENGQIAEDWLLYDSYTFQAQLGLLTPGPGWTMAPCR